MAFKTDSDSGRIYQQIEQQASTYPPTLYQLLTFYHGLQNETEPLDGQFIPLTTVQTRSPEEVKIFAIGLIPPAVTRIGGFLDRSATVASLEGSYDEIIEANPDVGSSSTGDLPGETGGVKTSTPTPVGPTSAPTDATKSNTKDDEFYTQYVVMCNRLGCQPEELAKVIQTECSWNEHAVAISKRTGQPIAKGLIQLVRSTANGLGIKDEQYNTFENTSAIDQLQYVEKYYAGRAKGRNAGELKAIVLGDGFNNKDGVLYRGDAKAPEHKDPELQRRAYFENSRLDGPPVKGYITVEDLNRRVENVKVNPKVLAGIQRAKERLGMGPESPAAVTEDAPAADAWNPVGSPNANEATETSARLSNKDLNATNLGKRFMDAQASTIRLMQAALDQIANTPPLRLLVNPQSFRVSADKLISSGNWGRNGPVIEHWGDNQDKIEGSGKIAAFYAMDIFDASGPGLSRTARQFSASYQNLLSLFLLYKNNGGVWLPDPLLPKSLGIQNLSVVGSVYLYYDEILYIGSFDSLSLQQDDGTPYSLEYSFSFTVRAWYLLDHLDDPQYTYGARSTPALPASNTGGSPLTGGNNPQPSPAVAPPPISPENDPLFGLGEGEVGPNLEGILPGL